MTCHPFREVDDVMFYVADMKQRQILAYLMQSNVDVVCRMYHPAE